jgi:tetratricopeptide (TPR) repeat protein
MRSGARRFLLPILLLTGIPHVEATPTLDDARTAYAEGRIAESIELYHRVAETAIEAGDAATAGIAHNNVCLVQAQHGDLEAALVDCRAALDLRRTLDDLRSLGRTQNNLGLILQHLARFEESEAAFREALAINRRRGDVEAETVNLANLGVTAIQAGWYAKAIVFQREALAIAEAHPDEPWAAAQARLAKVNQAVVLERLGAFREALTLYDQVLESSDEMPAARRATLLLNRGVAYRNLGDPHRARDAFLAAEETYRRVGELHGLSNVKLNLGLVHHLNLEDAGGAERHYREALRLSEMSGDRADEIQDLYYLGRLLTDLDQLAEAEALFARCLAASEESDSSEGRWAALAGLGRVEFARGERELALEHLEGAIDEIERVRGSLTGSELRSGYFGDKRAVYALTIELLAELDGKEPGAGHVVRALGLAHRAKARALLDRLGPAADRLEPPPPEEVVALIGGELLLEYFVAESRLFVWIVHRGRVELRAIDGPESILDDVARVHAALAGGEPPDAATLSELSASLLGGLPGSARPERIRIAPDGRLHYMPFELLPLDEGRLIERFTVSYLPSGAALAGFGRGPELPARSFVGFGDPVLPAETDAPTPTSLLVARFGLGPLPAAAGELAVAGRRLRGEPEIRTGAEATREAFAASVAPGARVVHLASHTVFDERPGRGAALLLSATDGSDGLMGPREIAELDYPVDLTVLAACRTALGAPDGGSALTMLTGAFLAAGSQAVIATLWDVGDVATGVFMEQFYYRLGKGDSPAVALREVKRRMLADDRWDDPSLWSAYVLIGETGSVVEPHGPWRLLGVLAAALLLGGLVYGLMRKREGSDRPVKRSSASNASTDQR